MATGIIPDIHILDYTKLNTKQKSHETLYTC
jgi:hypothetical protein